MTQGHSRHRPPLTAPLKALHGRRRAAQTPVSAEVADGAAPADPPADDPAAPAPGPDVVHAALYRHGVRLAQTDNLTDAYRAIAEAPGEMAWIDLSSPQADLIRSIGTEFELHPLVVEDALTGHQRPKLERYGDSLFAVVHSARYEDSAEKVVFGELHLILGPTCITTIRHAGGPDLDCVRQRLEAEPSLLALGPEAVLYGVIDAVVDNYLPVVRGLEQDVDEIEVEVFDSHSTGVSRRIYELSREAAAFQRSVRALRAMLADLTAGFAKYEVPPALQDYLRDVTDHLAQIRSRSDEVHASLRDILTVNATLVAQQQNEEMRAMTEVAGTENVQTKKITSWAAIIFAPTVIAGLYGMNFDIMPELHWAWGYPMALGLMVASAAVLYWWFKRSDWI